MERFYITLSTLLIFNSIISTNSVSFKLNSTTEQFLKQNLTDYHDESELGLKFLGSEQFDIDVNKRNLKKSINLLLESLLNKQCKHDVSFQLFPPRWAEIKGLFKSHIHLNVVDKKNSYLFYLLREKLKCKDMNMFVTNFVVKILLEIQQEGIINFNEEIITDSLKGMLQFQDHYQETTPIYGFWKQKMINGSWTQYPETMIGLMENQPNTEWIVKLLKFFGLKEAATLIETFNGMWKMFEYAYAIPADLDDTFTALAVTSFLQKVNNTNYNQVWEKSNSNLKGIFQFIKDISYRPFEDNEKQKERPLDPRTYFWLHDFISHSVKSKKSSLILPLTWLWTWKQHEKSVNFVRMPFYTNNIDLNVAGNYVFGVVNTVVYHGDKEQLNEIFEDTEVVQMITDTMDLFIFVIENNTIIKRPDITILYYPSIWDFYWLCSRVSFLIKSELTIKFEEIAVRNLNYKNLLELIKTLINKNVELDHVLRRNSMDYLLSKVIVSKDNKLAHVYEFLGNYANKERNEDAIFATGLTLNSLLNIWAIKKEGKLVWEADTAEETKELIFKMTRYLLINSHKRTASKEGAFFSGSVHSFYSGMPYFYPANFYKYINGTDFPPDDFNMLNNTLATIGVTGYFNDEIFDKEVKRNHYGQPTPLKADDLNGGMFPFWSSTAITESIVMLGFSKVHDLIN